MHELMIFYPQGHQAHAEVGHPERPERVESIREALQEVGWWDSYPHLAPIEIPDRILHSVHSPEYLANLERICKLGQRYDMDTYTTPVSWELANNAAGGAVAIAKKVWSNSARRGFAITRPPGHHATRNRAMGFCLINNVAIAAEYLIQEEGARRLAIIDIDLHHGNGTQDIFYQRGEVFYFSTHQHPHYPGTGSLIETGSGPGKKTTANFPMPPMSGDQALLTVMDGLIVPLLDRFSPEMILVSYGFDAHWRDTLGQLMLTNKGYSDLVTRLTSWADRNCDGRIALFLEGGYDLEAARDCSLAVVGALLGEVWEESQNKSNNTPPYPEGTAWQNMVQEAKEVWGV